MDVPLFCDEWTGEEELKLLTIIEEQGYGNWSSIGQRMCRSSEEVSSHYHQYYIDNPVSYKMQSKNIKQERKIYDTSHDQSHDLLTNYPGQEIPHYNPLRAEFDVELCNDAEKTLTISSIALESIGDDETKDEDQLTQQLVLALVDSYWHTLRYRDKVKIIIREHSLIDVYKILSKETLLPQSEQQIRLRMRRMTRFLNAENIEKIIQSLLNELKLVHRVKQLQHYRSLGIKSLQAGKLYEKLREKRIVMKEKRRKVFDDIRRVEILGNVTNNTMSDMTQKPKNTVVPLDITFSPGIDLLDQEEKDLCSTHRILPDVYLHSKNLMLAENKKTGHLRLMDARKLCRIDVNKTRKIYNLLVEKKLVHQPT